MSLVDAGGALQVDTVGSFVRNRPLVSAALLVVVVALVALGWWVGRRVRRTPGSRLQQVLARHDAVTVLMHPNPDPDAMASAMAVEALAGAVDTDATIQYPGQIRRQENRAFQTVLEQNFVSIDSRGEIEHENVVLVDHNEARGFPGDDGIDPIAVVDHHPGEGEGASFTDVRPDHGSCATIFAEYFADMGWEPVGSGGDIDDALTPILATGMMYGIQSDTNQLTKGCSPADFEAAGYLYEGLDEDKLDRVVNPDVDSEVLDIKAKAITNREIRNAFAVSNVGEVSNVDAIPQAAEELLRLEGVTAIVVVGTCDGTLHLSGRSRDDRVHMGKALKAASEGIPMAEAGGHARMGGGQLSVDHMEGIGPGSGVSLEEFTDRLFEAMTGELQ